MDKKNYGVYTTPRIREIEIRNRQMICQSGAGSGDINNMNREEGEDGDELFG